MAVKTVPRLGDLLLERRLISRAQLEAAVRQQREDGRPLGEILLARHFVSARQLRRTLNWQCWLRQAVAVASLGIGCAQTVSADERDLPNAYTARYTTTTTHDLSNLGELPTLYSAAVEARAREQGNRSYRRRLELQIKQALGEPVYTLLKGQYVAGVGKHDEGFRYTVKWRKDAINFEIRYQF